MGMSAREGSVALRWSAPAVVTSGAGSSGLDSKADGRAGLMSSRRLLTAAVVAAAVVASAGALPLDDVRLPAAEPEATAVAPAPPAATPVADEAGHNDLDTHRVLPLAFA